MEDRWRHGHPVVIASRPPGRRGDPGGRHCIRGEGRIGATPSQRQQWVRSAGVSSQACEKQLLKEFLINLFNLEGLLRSASYIIAYHQPG